MASWVNVPVTAVVGNCDWLVNGPLEQILIVEKYPILVTHGHAYNVKRGFDKLVNRARHAGVAICVFGHTHESFTGWEKGIFLLNPGTLRAGKGRPTYGILKIDCDGFTGVIEEL